jgi:hypothetical protein
MTLVCRVGALGAVLLLAGCTVAGPGTAASPAGASATAPQASAPSAVAAADPARRGPHPVAAAAYDLGDSALRVPGFFAVDPVTGAPDRSRLAPIEVTAVAHYPADPAGGPYPLVLLLHGAHETCADRAAGAAWNAAYRPALAGDRRAAATLDAARARLVRWPCAPGTPTLPSLRGFDYLGERLASHGMIAVSVGANGIAAGAPGPQQDEAAGALISRHLELWGRAAPVQGVRADLGRVVVVGHDRGGNDVAWYAAHRSSWPPGVTVRAALTLAPVYAAEPDSAQAAAYRAVVPLATLTGSCDSAGRPGAANLLMLNPGAHGFVVAGGNHNNINTAWAPASGQVLARDDVAFDLLTNGDTAPAPGRCRDAAGHRADRQLGEDEQRAITAAYVTGFAGHALTPGAFPREPATALTTVDENVVPTP